ncbi:MAG TPA: hypothetical protein VJZ76_23445 [Thermoanaerobaculia bacterium]|nr:hypothetical protein [Thermoanaerobaculia bacterium]
MQNIGIVTVLMLLAAFALERVGAAAGFLIPEAESDKRKKWRKVAIFAITGVVAYAIVQLSNDVRILRYLQPKPDVRTDALLTWLVLVAGSDQVKTVAGWLASSAAGKEAPVSPIRVVMDKAA